jgi:hypothetical protein
MRLEHDSNAINGTRMEEESEISRMIMAGLSVTAGILFLLVVTDCAVGFVIVLCCLWCSVVPFLRKNSVGIRIMLWLPAAALPSLLLFPLSIPFVAIFAWLFFGALFRHAFIKRERSAKWFGAAVIFTAVVATYPLSFGPASFARLYLLKHKMLNLAQANLLFVSTYAPILWAASRSPTVHRYVTRYSNAWDELFLSIPWATSSESRPVRRRFGLTEIVFKCGETADARSPPACG